MDIKVNVQGLKGIEDALSNFPPNLVKKAFREAMRAAAAPQIEAAKAKAPVMTKATSQRYPGELRDSIGVDIKVGRNGVHAKVGPRREKGAGNQSPGAWGLMEEFGSIHNPAQPYLRPAFDETKDKSVEEFAAVLRTMIESGAIK